MTMTFCFPYETRGDGMESYGISCYFDWYTDVTDTVLP
jgi:hypothetical protein